MTKAEPEQPEPPPPPLGELPAMARRGIVAYAVVLSALGLTGTALSPYLLVKHPLLLVALAPDPRHLVLVAPQVDLLSYLAVCVPRRSLALVATYLVAGLYGYRMVRYAQRRFPRVGRFLFAIARALDRVGPVLLFVLPLHSLAGASGATGMPVRRFLAAIVPGQLPFLVTHYYFGEAISGVTAKVVAFLSEHLVESTLVTAGLVLVQQLVSRLRRRRIVDEAEQETGMVE